MRNLRTFGGRLFLTAVLPAVVIASACGSGNSEPTATPTDIPPTLTATLAPTDTPRIPTAPPTPTVDGCPEAIPWDETDQHVDEWVTARGPVVRTFWAEESGGQPTFLDIGRPYPDPDRFSVVIWVENRSKFQPSPEQVYFGEMVCVTGHIYLYRGVTQMEVDEPSDIEIVR